MTEISPQITQWIPSNFPNFYRTKGPNFVAFTKSFYEFLSQSNNVYGYARSFLDNMDIDKTGNEFIKYFQDEFMANLPPFMSSDPRFLMKHILDLYRSKGTPRGYELLFRILFNTDIKIYIPGNDIFKLSDNTWQRQTYIEVSDSPYLSELIGELIYSSSAKSTALCEEYNVVTVNNKVINVLTISHLNGNFLYGDYILANGVSGLNINNAPQIIGSLSAIGIENGGVGFNVGDLVKITGSGGSALGRVSSVATENGKVIFQIQNGGDGYTVNAQVQVVGGGGAGATFSVGSIVDPQTFLINLDVINNYYNTQLDIASEGFQLHISNVHGTFSLTEVVQSNANGVALDFAYLNANTIANGEVLSNSSLNISSLTVIEVDNPNFVNLVGPQASLTNANLKSGIILQGATSGTLIYINSVLPVTNYLANGTLTAVNSTTMSIDNANGYFLPTSNIVGLTSGANAYVNATIRMTNWGFPGDSSNSNLDSPINTVLTYETLVAGKIATLTGINSGDGYSSNPTITVTEPLVYSLQLPDGSGGFLGGDANITGNTIGSNGVVTSVQVIQSGFGFVPNEQVTCQTPNGDIAITGSAIVDQQGITEGSWLSNKSFISDNQFLEDSYYYQNFSYEIIAPMMLNVYEQFVREIMHPTGYALFGSYGVNDTQNSTCNSISFSLH